MLRKSDLDSKAASQFMGCILWRTTTPSNWSPWLQRGVTSTFQQVACYNRFLIITQHSTKKILGCRRPLKIDAVCVLFPIVIFKYYHYLKLFKPVFNYRKQTVVLQNIFSYLSYLNTLMSFVSHEEIRTGTESICRFLRWRIGGYITTIPGLSYKQTRIRSESTALSLSYHTG